jgi:hypothetical protein
MRTEVKYILELIRDKTITIDDGINKILNIFDVIGSSISEPPKPPQDRTWREGSEPPKPKNYR